MKVDSFEVKHPRFSVGVAIILKTESIKIFNSIIFKKVKILVKKVCTNSFYYDII